MDSFTQKAAVAAAALVALHCLRERSTRERSAGVRGAIYMTGGPSGAGKDTLLLAAGDRLAADPQSKVVFIKRHITRDPSKTTDIEIPVSESDFDASKAAGDFALSWEAHSTKYAIPRKELDEALALGQRCVLNVSRSVIQQTRDTYGSIADVYFLNITATEASLRSRLLGRSRESAEEVEKRVARAKQSEPSGGHVIHIMNEASIEEGCTQVVDALAGQLRYSIWLTPAQDNGLRGAIDTLAASHGSAPFAPHMTLCPSFKNGQLSAIDLAKAVAAALAGQRENSGIPVKLGAITHSEAKFRAVVSEVELNPALANATATARRLIFSPQDPETKEPFAPHVSLLYGEYDASVRQAASAKAGEMVSKGAKLRMTDVVLMMTTGDSYQCWREVARFPIGKFCRFSEEGCKAVCWGGQAAELREHRSSGGGSDQAAAVTAAQAPEEAAAVTAA
jgi:ribose 1,5-bisphosphokinase